MKRHQNPLAVSLATALYAGSAPALADAPKLSEIFEATGIAVNGYVAASYFHSSELNSFHSYDVGHDAFQLDQAALTVAYQPDGGFGAVVNIVAGEDTRLQNIYEYSGGGSTYNVLQAYAQYAKEDLTLMAGKFTTLAGTEVFAPTGNVNFSRSLLFNFQPVTHTGIRASYAVNENLTVMAGVNNGWNYTRSSYGSKTAELGVSLTPSPKFIMTAQAYVGRDPIYDARRTLVDTVVTINATDALTFVLNYDWAKQASPSFFGGGPDARWNGLAAYINLKLNSQWRLSMRGEYLDDEDGFLSGTEQKLKEGTVTLGYAPAEHFEVRLEGRYDKSPGGSIAEFHSPSPFGNSFTDSQTEFALQGVYKF